MKNSKNLKNRGIRCLKSQFSGDEEKHLIEEKFKNISGKTGRYFVPEKLFQQRTARKNRVLIPFSHVLENNISYSQLNTFEGGVVVEFVNNDFFEQLKLPENSQNNVFKILKTKLGCDDNVSAIIDIRSVGDSSSQVQREALENLKIMLKKENKKIEDVLIRRKDGIKYSGQGNEIWHGYVYYSIRGGQQDTTDSHTQYNIKSSEVQLFNPSVEYAGERVSIDITLVLIYFALYSVDKQKRNNEWNEIVEDYLEYFGTREYYGKNLREYVKNHISLNLEPGLLMDPIQIVPIKIEEFTISARSENALDITHQLSVNKHNYLWDSKLGLLLTPARPTNLSWSKHLSNMMQQDFSLKEYFQHQREIIEKWDKFGIDGME